MIVLLLNQSSQGKPISIKIRRFIRFFIFKRNDVPPTVQNEIFTAILPVLTKVAILRIVVFDCAD